MHHPAVCLTAVGFALSACGGLEPEETSGSTQDLRQQLVGTYDVSGTLTLTVNGVSSSSPVNETLVLEPRSGSDALALALVSRGCGLDGKVSGARSFVLQGRSCTLPPEDSCDLTLNFSGGSGGLAQGNLQVSLQASLLKRCGQRTSATRFSLELSGPPR